MSVISRPTDADDDGAAEMTRASSVAILPDRPFSLLGTGPGPSVVPVRSCNSHCSTNAVRARSSSINYGCSSSGGGSGCSSSGSGPRISTTHAQLEQTATQPSRTFMLKAENPGAI